MSTVETLPHHSERESDASLLTIAEVCAELRVSRSTVWRLCRDGELTAFRFGNRTRVLASSVEDMLVRGVRQRSTSAGPAILSFGFDAALRWHDNPLKSECDRRKGRILFPKERSR